MSDARSHLNGTQFHEMTRGEFESQPGTWFHGTQTGHIGHQESSFHVGSRAAATEALAARIGKQYVHPDNRAAVIQGHPSAQIYGGRITAPMSNKPMIHPSRGPGGSWQVREGIPRGAMEDWKRRSPTEAMSDVKANAVEHGIRTKGQKMRKGIYYVNASEGSHEENPISAIVPNRAGFKTHEDHLVEARAAGKKIPKRAMKGYTQIPGQGRLF